MSAGSSFSNFFGGGCGLVLGVCLALVLIPVVAIIGCGVLSGGCLMLGTAAKEAADAAKQAAKEQQPPSGQTEESEAELQPPSESAIPHDPPDATIPDKLADEKQATPEPPPEEYQPEPKPEPEPPVVQNEKLRTWTDKSGEYSVEAEFISMAFGKVKLKKADGTIITMPLDRLSDDDRKWIQEKSKGRNP